MINVGLLFSFFYIVVVSWSVWYLVASIVFIQELPWTKFSQENSTMHFENYSSVIATQKYWSVNVLGQVGKDWETFVSVKNYIATHPHFL